MVRRSFRAMGTDIELLVDAAGVRRGDRRPPRWSSSGSNRCCRASGRPPSSPSSTTRGGSTPPPTSLEVVRLALAARTRTNGRFDPTVHDALVAAGYDRTFDDVPAEGAGRGERLGSAAAEESRSSGSRITLDPGVRLDLGGIGKGFAAERVASLLAARRAPVSSAPAATSRCVELRRATCGRSRSPTT